MTARWRPRPAAGCSPTRPEGQLDVDRVVGGNAAGSADGVLEGDEIGAVLGKERGGEGDLADCRFDGDDAEST